MRSLLGILPLVAVSVAVFSFGWRGRRGVGSDGSAVGYVGTSDGGNGCEGGNGCDGGGGGGGSDC